MCVTFSVIPDGMHEPEAAFPCLIDFSDDDLVDYVIQVTFFHVVCDEISLIELRHVQELDDFDIRLYYDDSADFSL